MRFWDCPADFDVDNVQRCELVNFYGVWRYIRVIIVVVVIVVVVVVIVVVVVVIVVVAVAAAAAVDVGVALSIIIIKSTKMGRLNSGVLPFSPCDIMIT